MMPPDVFGCRSAWGETRLCPQGLRTHGHLAAIAHVSAAFVLKVGLHMLCVAFEVCLIITLPQNGSFVFLCTLDWGFGSLSIS